MPHVEPTLKFNGQNVYFNRLFDTVGDGTGTQDFIGDYSGGGAVAALVKAQADEALRVHRIIGTIGDSGSIAADGYGALTARTVGLMVGKYDVDGTLVHNLLGNGNLTNHLDIAGLCYDINLVEFGTSSEKLVVWRWSFAIADMPPITLYPGETLQIILNDSFVGLTHHDFAAQGTRTLQEA